MDEPNAISVSDKIPNLSTGTDVCWCLTPGAAGFISQTTGLAQAVGLKAVQKSMRLRLPWKPLPVPLIPISDGVVHNRLSLRDEPAPKLVISCGRSAVVPALWLKKQFGSRVLTVHIQNPTISPASFDLVAAPEHDAVDGANVIATAGAIHHVTPQRLERARLEAVAQDWWDPTRPLVTVLLGGPNRYYAFSRSDFDQLLSGLRQVTTNTDAKLLILTSRRTPEYVRSSLVREFADTSHEVCTEQGGIAYFSALAAASWIVVTGDSVSMASEAVFTGKPVLVQHLTERRRARRFRAFHESFVRRGYTRPFRGDLERWTYKPPDDRERIAEIILNRLEQ